MSDPSGGNFPPGGGGKGSNVPRGGSGGATPTVTDPSTGSESLPDDDGWGTASDSPVVGVPVKTPAAYAATEMLPVQPAPATPPEKPKPAATLAGDGPTIAPSGDTQPPPTPQATGTGTAPFAAPPATPYGEAPMGAAPGAPSAPVVHPHYGNYGPPGAPPPVQAAPRAVVPRNRQLVMLAGILGGLFLLLGIVVGIVALRSKSAAEPAVADVASAAPVAEPAPTPPPEPTPIAPPVTVAPAAVHPAPKAKKDAGAAPASSSSAKPAGSTSPPPSTSSSGTQPPGGATGADAGRRGRKVAH